MIDRLLGDIDEDQARKLLQRIDEDQLRQGLHVAVEDFVVPHVDEVRTKATEDYEDRHFVREQYRQMSDEQQQEVFDEAWGDLVAVCARIREDPQNGGMELKERLRDPWTMEALLLIFENKDHIDPEYGEEMKEFTTYMVRWMAIQMLPEMYSQDEVRESIEQLFDDADYERAMREYGLEP